VHDDRSLPRWLPALLGVLKGWAWGMACLDAFVDHVELWTGRRIGVDRKESLHRSVARLQRYHERHPEVARRYAELYPERPREDDDGGSPRSGSPGRRARRRATIQLAAKPSEDARRALIAALGDIDKTVRSYALGGLLSIGARGIELNGPAIREALRAGVGAHNSLGNDAVYEQVRCMFEEGGPWRNLGLTPVLTEVLASSPDAGRRGGAAYKLGAIRTAEAIRALLDGARRERSAKVRRAIAEALARHVNHPGVRDALQALASDSDADVRRTAKEALLASEHPT
jgi:hypothetical protein